MFNNDIIIFENEKLIDNNRVKKVIEQYKRFLAEEKINGDKDV